MNQNINKITDISQFPKENDNNFKIYNLNDKITEDNTLTGFDEKEITIEDITFRVACYESEDLTGDDVEECLSARLYSGYKELTTFSVSEDSVDIIITDEYIILQYGIGFVSPGILEIYDKTGKYL